MEILRVENLCKTYGKGEAKVNVLKNVSFSLEKGEYAPLMITHDNNSYFPHLNKPSALVL